jgi:hypothetical protein
MEWYFATLASALHLIFQVNAALHHGWRGQDFTIHLNFIKLATAQPLQFLTHYTDLRTNPPLFHYLASLVYKATGAIHYLEVIALISACLNLTALLLLYGAIRDLFESMAIRLACLILLLFLPFAMIHAEVLAADALATPVFFLAVCALVRIATGKAQSRAAYISHLAGLCAALLVGVGVKFTFGSLLIATVLCVLVLERARLLTRRRALLAVALVVILPGGTALFELATYLHDQVYRAGLNSRAREMNFRSVLFFRPHDVDILGAPGYYSPAAEQSPAASETTTQNYNLLMSNKHSYLALLHLGMYTDLLDIYQNPPGTRSRANQRKMALAVKAGIPFSLCMLLLTPVMGFRSLYRTIIARKAEMSVIAIMSLAAGLFFLNIALPMPFATNAYSAGYWTPRLVAPALLSFAVITFAAIDGLLRGRSKAWGYAILLAVVGQATLHASFLWPWGITSAEPGPAAPLMEAASFPSDAIVIEAESFSAGNVVPDFVHYGVGIGVIISPRYPAYAEYRVRIPSSGGYELFARFASAESRALSVWADGEQSPLAVATDPTGGYGPSDQRWQRAGTVELAAGVHTVRVASVGPFPCLDKIALVPVWYVTAANDRPAKEAANTVGVPINELLDDPHFPKHTLILEAERFSRGNAVVDYGSYGQGIGVVVTASVVPAFVEYDLKLPSDGDYDLYIRYATAEPRPMTVTVNGREITASACSAATGGWDPSRQRWQKAGSFYLAAGSNRLRLSRAGVFPAIDKIALRPSR